MKKTLCIFFAFTFLVAALVVSVIVGHRQKVEIDRLKKNQTALLNPTTIEFRTTDGKSVAEIQALNLKVSELKASNDSLLRVAHDLGIKNRRLMELAQTTSETQTVITTVVKDSIVYLPGRTDTLSCLSFADPWLSLSGCIQTDTFCGTIQSRDTLDFIVHRIPKRFLFFRFGCKAIQLDAVSHNPHSTLTHARYIRLNK